MTKEELAKKKGIKNTQNTQTAAESILTTQPKTESIKEDKKEPKKETKPKTTTSKSNTTKKTTTPKKTTAKKEEPKVEEINKAGRPKGKPSTKISLNVPDEYLELVNIAAGINYKGNTSSYIVELIKKDLEANGKVYEQIKAIKQS